MSLDATITQCNELKKKLQTGDLEGCKPLLSKLKVALIKIGFLPVEGSASKQELHIAREILELGAQWALKSEDIAAFERYISQLKPYYFDFNNDSIPESPFMYELLGLNLLCLLSQNRIADFHMELERLDPTQLHSNIYLKHPVSLEQYLMEGAYNKVFLSRGNVPADSYTFFVDKLMATIRDEIASCCEKAYKTLPKAAATRLLLLGDDQDIATFASEREWSQTAGSLSFPEVVQDNTTTSSVQLISQTLGYAKELEKIV